jgi:hypothetical protein
MAEISAAKMRLKDAKQALTAIPRFAGRKPRSPGAFSARAERLCQTEPLLNTAYKFRDRIKALAGKTAGFGEAGIRFPHRGGFALPQKGVL